MKTHPLSVLVAALSLALSGCCITPTHHTHQHPAIVIDSPCASKRASGSGILEVKMRQHCLSSQSTALLEFWVDGKAHHFNQEINQQITLKSGVHTLSFKCVDGYVTPPTVPVTVCPEGPTSVLVNYNKLPRKESAHAAPGPVKHGMMLMASGLDTTPGTIYVSNSPIAGSSACTLTVISAVPNPNGGQWWLPTGGPKPFPAGPLAMPNSGTTTVTFGPIPNYNAPNPSTITLGRGKKITVYAYYHPQQ